MENRKSRNNILSESLKKKNQNTRTELILKTVIQENSGNKRKPEFTYWKGSLSTGENWTGVMNFKVYDCRTTRP